MTEQLSVEVKCKNRQKGEKNGKNYFSKAHFWTPLKSTGQNLKPYSKNGAQNHSTSADD